MLPQTTTFLLSVASFFAVISGCAVLAQETASGCGKFHNTLGFTTYRSLKSSGRERNYGIHIPFLYYKDNQYPVVFGFHGSPGNGFFLEADTKLSEPRFSGSKIMIYPNGVNGSWAGASYSTVSVEEDLQFMSDILQDLRSNYCIDNKRIYATGISNGAGFVNLIACSDLGNQFAAFAPASGAYYADSSDSHGDCRPPRSPMPILSIHGGSDKTVLYEGGKGEGGQLPSIEQWLGYWVDRDGCKDRVVSDSFGNSVHHSTWTCENIQNALQHWKVDDMGHCWASTEPNFTQLYAGQGPAHIEANDLIMAFFDAFPLP